MEMEKEILGTLKNIQATLDEHGQFLSALRTGQEGLKAEIEGMKLQNAKEFGEIKDRLENLEVSQEVLKDEIWTNKKDIHRLKNSWNYKTS